MLFRSEEQSVYKNQIWVFHAPLSGKASGVGSKEQLYEAPEMQTFLNMIIFVLFVKITICNITRRFRPQSIFCVL